MDNQQERFELKIAWLSAIIEGEGWVSLSKISTKQSNGNYRSCFLPVIGIANTDILIINEVKMIIEKLGAKYRFSTRKSRVYSDGILRKERYEVSCATKNDVKILGKAILAFMIGEKKRRLEKIFEFFEVRSSRKGNNSKYGKEENEIYESLYKYKGNRSSKILNDCTPNTNVS